MNTNKGRIIILGAVIRKPADLQDLAPGTNPPFVTFNGEVKVDVNKIEEFLEEKLTPPRYKNTQTDEMSQRSKDIHSTSLFCVCKYQLPQTGSQTS